VVVCGGGLFVPVEVRSRPVEVAPPVARVVVEVPGGGGLVAPEFAPVFVSVFLPEFPVFPPVTPVLRVPVMVFVFCAPVPGVFPVEAPELGGGTVEVENTPVPGVFPVPGVLVPEFPELPVLTPDD